MTYYIYCKGRKASASTLQRARAKSYDMFFIDGERGGRCAMIYKDDRYIGATIEFYSIGSNNHYKEYLAWYSNGKLYRMDSSGYLGGVYSGKPDKDWVIELIKDHRKEFLSQRK